MSLPAGIDFAMSTSMDAFRLCATTEDARAWVEGMIDAFFAAPHNAVVPRNPVNVHKVRGIALVKLAQAACFVNIKAVYEVWEPLLNDYSPETARILKEEEVQR
jgi:hypothetical protein